MFRTNNIFLKISFLLIALSWTNVHGADVSFDHFTGKDQSISINAKAGEAINISIQNTCASKFRYELGGIPLPSPPPAKNGTSNLSPNICPAETHPITQIHDPQFGGYYISVDPINGPTVTAAKLDKDGKPIVGEDGRPIEAKELSKATYLVLVRTDQWDLAFSGGFTISDLTDPVFVTRVDDAMQNIVARDTSSEDSASLGLAAMVHIYHQKRPWLAATFGIATGNDDETAYMVGPSYRFSDKAAVTFGYMFSPVDTLPNGVNIGDAIHCLLYTSPSPRDGLLSRMPSSA